MMLVVVVVVLLLMVMMPFHSIRYLAGLWPAVSLEQWRYTMCQHLPSTAMSVSCSFPSEAQAPPNTNLTLSTPVCT